MNLFKNINILINKILVKIFYNSNLIFTSNLRIHPTATVHSSILAGDVEIKEMCKIIDGVSIQIGSSFGADMNYDINSFIT